MSFWDRFVLWVYLGLADTLPAGREAAGRLYDLAFTLGRLSVADLNELSLLLLASCAPVGSAVRTAALAEVIAHDLPADPIYVRDLLDTLRAPRVTELLELNRPHQAAAAQLLCNALTHPPGHEVWINLTEFLQRARLLDPEDPTDPNPEQDATGVLLDAVRIYLRFPIGTVDFISVVYRHALGFLGGRWQLPFAIPDPVPAWFANLEPDEQTFLRRCFPPHLSPSQRVVMLLHFDGRATAEQIAGVLHFADPNWTTDTVIEVLETSWIAVLW